MIIIKTGIIAPKPLNTFFTTAEQGLFLTNPVLLYKIKSRKINGKCQKNTVIGRFFALILLHILSSLLTSCQTVNVARILLPLSPESSKAG